MNVNLFQTPDDGDISFENGVIEMDGGLSSCVYLSLFGGNEDDDGREKNNAGWWGNIDEEPHKKYISRTQFLLQSIPASSGNLLRVQDAINEDLKWLLDRKLASEITVSASIPALNSLHVMIMIDGKEVSFTENWQYDYNQKHIR